MPYKPSVNELRLEPCCKKVLKEIDEKIEMGRLLRLALVGSSFGAMFGSNPVEVIFTIVSTDWEDLTRATRMVTPIVKNRCQTIAQLHSFDHPGGNLNDFWTAMADSFS